MRTLVDIPEDDILWLDARARAEGKSRTAVVREAVSAYRAEQAQPADKSWIREGAGYWKGRHDIPDSVEYQRAIREDRDIDSWR
jgi:hypothetical protein